MANADHPTTRRRREPTGFNIHGETMAEYYQRRMNERGTVIERAKEALLDIQDAVTADGVGIRAAVAKLCEALESDGR